MMNEEWLETFHNEVKFFAEKAKEFDEGTLARKDYKGFSGGLGSYAQHDPSKHMLRLRMAGGHLTQARLAFLADSVAKYNIDTMKLTTCETIQLHNLSADKLPALMEEAVSAEIYVKGGGGDNPRNVMVSPLTGLQKGEAFDVMPYAEAAAEYLLTICRDIKMPRKLKVAFCNGVDDSCHTSFRDMGFLALPDGTFRLSIAGGLGANHKMGITVVDALPATQILYAIRAMIETFCQHGCYTNRAKARTRYMQEFLGVDGLKTAYLENLEKEIAKGGLDCVVEAKPVAKLGIGSITDQRVIPQKQAGLYAVSYHPLGGILPPEKPAELLKLFSQMQDVECRIAPNETLYIVNLTAEEARKVLEATEDGSKTPFEYSVACIGSEICQQGVRNSQAVLRKLVAAVRAAELPAGALPVTAISGCPSSCAAPQAAAIGLLGGTKVVNGKAESAFKVFVGGSDALGQAKFGDAVATVLETDLPEMFVELGKAAGDCWVSFYGENPQMVLDIITAFGNR